MMNNKRKVVTDLVKPKKKYLYQERHIKESIWKSEDVRKNQENAVSARKQKNSSMPLPKKQKQINYATTSCGTGKNESN